MIRIAIAFAAVVSLAAPVIAQTNIEGAAQGTSEAAPAVSPAPSATGTNLPGVTDTTTTGSTGTNPSEPAPDQRCELPGNAANANPTAEVPSVREADPTCR